MKKIYKYINNCFKKRNNIIFFVLSTIISMVLSIGLSTSRINSRIAYSDSLSFPEDYSYVYGFGENCKDAMNKDFYGLDYTILRKCVAITNLNVELENVQFEIIGVDEDFLSFPLPNGTLDDEEIVLEKNEIILGKEFTTDDIMAKTKTIIMNSYYLQCMKYNGEDIFINGHSFKLKGILGDTASIKRTDSSTQIIVPIYMPYTTAEELVGKTYLHENCVVKTNGLRFKEYEDEYGPRIVSKYIYEKNMNDAEQEQIKATIPLVASLLTISFVAIFIVQYIIVKNKHFEIGIKRAIGASRSDIILEFIGEFTLVIYSATIFGFLLGIVTTIIYYFPKELNLLTPIIYFNFNVILIVLSMFILFAFLASFASLYLGTKINIASIIVEER